MLTYVDCCFTHVVKIPAAQYLPQLCVLMCYHTAVRKIPILPRLTYLSVRDTHVYYIPRMPNLKNVYINRVRFMQQYDFPSPMYDHNQKAKGTINAAQYAHVKDKLQRIQQLQIQEHAYRCRMFEVRRIRRNNRKSLHQQMQALSLDDSRKSREDPDESDCAESVDAESVDEPEPHDQLWQQLLQSASSDDQEERKDEQKEPERNHDAVTEVIHQMSECQISSVENLEDEVDRLEDDEVTAVWHRVLRQKQQLIDEVREILASRVC